MILQKTLTKLKDLGCLNPEEYVDVRTHNLRWNCKDCGKEYQRSLMHQKKGTGCCEDCGKNRNNTRQKISKDVLVSLGCLNAEEYINSKTKNMLWACSCCGGSFIASYASQKSAMHLCPSCVAKETIRPHKNSESTLVGLGILNVHEYVDTKTNNLRCNCVTCGEEFITSLSTLKKSNIQCKKCRYQLIASKTKKKANDSELLTTSLNNDEYVNSNSGNLLWACSCGNTYTRSLAGQQRSNKCPECATTTRRTKKRLSEYKLITNGCLNGKEYSALQSDTLLWRCPECGEVYARGFTQQVNGRKLCNACVRKKIGESRRATHLMVVKIGALNPEDYINATTKNLKYSCDNCGKIYISSYSVLGDKRNSKHLCETCNPSTSSHELEIVEFIKSIYSHPVLQNTRDIISPLELDVYLPDLKLAIELNGIYWHSAQYKPKQYHKIKYDACKAQGIKLLQFWDTDWINNSELIKSMLSTQIVKDNKKVFARNCKILEVSLSDSMSFLATNHIQGFGSAPTVTLGLYNNEELQAVMCFKKTTDTVYDLTRFCTLQGLTVVGGASRLLKYFIRTYVPEEVTSFSDNMYSDGGLYETLGFSKVQSIPVDYKYLDNGVLNHKFGYRHSKLVNKLEAYDSNLSEYQNCLNHGIQRVYDSGKIKWSLKI